MVFSKLLNLFTLIVSFYLFYLIVQFASHDFVHYKIILALFKEYQLAGTSFADYYRNPDVRLEPGTFILFWNFSKVFSIVNILMIISFCILFIKYLLFKKYLENHNIAFIFYVLCFGFLWDANQIRVAIALCFIIYILISNRSKISKLFFIIFASFFHLSSLFFLGMYSYLILEKYLNKNLALYLFLVIILCFIVLILKEMILIYGVFSYYTGKSLGGEIFRPLTIVHFLIICTFLMNYGSLTHLQKQGLMILILGFIFFIIFIDIRLVSVRIRELSFVAFIPMFFARGAVKNTYFYLSSLPLIIFSMNNISQLYYYIFINPLPGIYEENYMRLIN